VKFITSVDCIVQARGAIHQRETKTYFITALVILLSVLT